LGIVTKRIKGIEYQYYQTPYKTKDKTIIVTTEIGRKDLDPKEFSKRRSSAMLRHGNKIRKLYFTPERLTKYHFEHSPTVCNILGVEQLKFAQLTLVDELTRDERREFERLLFTKYVYGTTSLEGNTYSEGETDKLLNTGLTSGNKTHREATEITNYLEVRSFVNDYRGIISEQFIKNIQSILMKGIKDDNGKLILTGKYRTIDKGVRGISFKLCRPEKIEEKMKELISEYEFGVRKSVHPLELACIFHQKFEEIHPFVDGNGRTGREILNFMLRRNGFPEIYIPPNERSNYLTALEEGNLSNYVPLIDFIFHRTSRTLLYYLTKSNASDDLLSDEFAEFYKSTEGEENYAKFKSLFNSLHKNEILP
jgi:Fic family protein